MNKRFHFRLAKCFGAAFSITVVGLFLFFPSYTLSKAEDYSTPYSPYLPSSLCSFSQTLFPQMLFSFTSLYLPAGAYYSSSGSIYGNRRFSLGLYGDGSYGGLDVGVLSIVWPRPEFPLGMVVQGIGRVLDSAGNGIDGLIVRIKGSDIKTFTISILNNSRQIEGGYYFLHDVPAVGSFELEVVSPDSNQILAAPTVEDFVPYKLNLIPDISLTQERTSSVYSESLRRLNLPVDLPPEGDYDEDGLSNQEEVLRYLTHPGLTTLPLFLTEGLNLFYFPSVVDALNVTPALLQLYSYNPETGCWEEENSLKQDRLNALYTSSLALLFLNLRSDNQKPVLSLRGFNLAFDQQTTTNPMNTLFQDIFGFDPACFEPDASTLGILERDTFTGVHLISSLNSGHGKWESSYRFFGKPAGDEMRVKSTRVYTLIKGKEE